MCINVFEKISNKTLLQYLNSNNFEVVNNGSRIKFIERVRI